MDSLEDLIRSKTAAGTYEADDGVEPLVVERDGELESVYGGRIVGYPESIRAPLPSKAEAEALGPTHRHPLLEADTGAVAAARPS